MRPTDWKEARKITMDQLLAMEARRDLVDEMERMETETWGGSMSDEKERFLTDLVAQHKAVTRPDAMSYDSEQYLVQCPACDGHTWQIRRKGDPDYECEKWIRARALGVLPVGEV